MRVKFLPQDNEARLNGGIVFYDKKPYYLSLLSATTAQLQSIYRKTNPETLNVSLNDQKIDISSPTLGFVNAKNEAIYVMRTPSRRYKQLLTYSSLTAEAVMTGRFFGGDSLHDVVHSAAGEKMLLNEYPDLAGVLKALTKTDGKIMSMAISRNIALSRDSFDRLRVYYKLDFVGTIEGNTVKVPKADLAWVVSRYLEGFDWKVE